MEHSYLNETRSEIMDKFCGSVFWNSNLTWHSDNPEFTKCFENTVLIWIPCIFVCIFCPQEIYYIKTSKERNITWNIFNISKALATGLLIVLKLVDIGMTANKSSLNADVHSVDYVSPAIQILTFVLANTLMYYNKKHGLRASGILFFYWLLQILCGLPQLRREAVKYQNAIENDKDVFNFYSYIIYYILNTIMFCLNCFADMSPKNSIYTFNEKKPCPEKASGYLSRLTFSWFDRTIYTGFRRTLGEKDMWALNPPELSKEVVPIFDKYWKKACRKKNKPEENTTSEKKTFEKSSASIDLTAVRENKPISVFPILSMAFGVQYLFGSLLKFLSTLITFVSPQLLGLLIKFVEGDEPMWKGYLYAIALMVIGTSNTFMMTHYFHIMNLVSMKVKSSLVSAIYRKSLRMSNTARKDSTVGEIVNLMSVDTDRIQDFTIYIDLLWSSPILILGSLFFLWNILGPSVLAGFAILLILIPINAYIAKQEESLQMKLMKYKDERVKLTNEVLNGIKVLKMYAWETSFEKEIGAIRNKEMNVLRRLAYLKSSLTLVWLATPFFVSLISFGCFVMISDDNILTSNIAFVSLSLFNVMRFPLIVLPNVISSLIQTIVSLRRVNKFMNSEDLDFSSVEHDPSYGQSLTIKDGSFSWGENTPILKNISLSIPSGSLVAVVGFVGSGKSSFLSAILGEMKKLSGRVNVVGSTAYVPQQAWMLNASLRDNILFGKDYNKRTYERVITGCALKPDLAMLTGGDKIEIGEKGINLSGGQKQRISLARAVYADMDIYLLDDPLSAVDSHVGKHIFDKIIGPSGYLYKKTRILVTHSITYLSQVDRIIVLKDGEISEAGTYNELLQKKGSFSEFIATHSTEYDKHDADESDSPKDGKAQKVLPRSLSESSDQGRQRRSSENLFLMKQMSTDGKELNEDENKLIEDEKAGTGNVKWAVYKEYLQSAGVSSCIWSLVMLLCLLAFQVASNFWLSRWSNANDEFQSINGTDNVPNTNMYLAVYGVLGFLHAIFAFFGDLIPYLAFWKAAKIIHNNLLSNILHAPVWFFDTTPIGRILSRFSKDLNIMDARLPAIFSDVTFCFFDVTAALFIISISTPMFTTVILPIVLIYFLLQRFYIPTSRQLKRMESVSMSPVYNHFGESLAGVQSIRAYGVSERFISESETRVDNHQALFYPCTVGNRWLAIRLEMIGNFIIFFTALFAVLNRKGASSGLVGLSITYALEITQPLTWLMKMSSEMETNIVAVERVKEYTDVEQEAEREIQSTAPHADWPDQGSVDMYSLELKYRRGDGKPGEPAISDITCHIGGGEKVGIVGRTGAGKSTLTLGLFRIIETAGGSITIDGIDISKIGLHQLRSKLTIIPQDAVLFSGTLRINLDPFNVHTDEELWRSLENAHLKTFVKGLTAGLNHEISEGGQNLSSGQRQLVCLARALLRKTKVLILDEATAAIDLETDNLIQETIRSKFAHCTVLTIAHRLNTIMDSTRVMVLDKGRLVEFASPQELLNNKQSIFYGMAKDAGLVS